MGLAGASDVSARGKRFHSFDWVLAGGMKPDEMDMSENIRFTLRKGVSLKAIPLPVPNRDITSASLKIRLVNNKMASDEACLNQIVI